MGSFLERPGNFSGPKANFKIKKCWIVAQFLAHTPVNWKFHCIFFKQIKTLILHANTTNTKQISEPEKLPGFRETGPRTKKSQIKRGSIAAIIHFLIRFADGRSLPTIRSSRSRMLCNSFHGRKLKKRKETILKDTKDGPGIQRESFGNNTDSQVLFVIASSVTSPLIPHNSPPVLRTNTFSNLD